MKLGTALLWVALGLAGVGPGAAAPGHPDAAAEGRALVAELLAQRPAQDLTNAGFLFIRPAAGAGARRLVPVRMILFVTPAGWTTVYEAAPTNTAARACLRVTRHPDRGNEYQLVEGNSPDGLPAQGRCLAGAELWQPFAGSDFWVADLGLEFLHWPTQRLLRRELRRGQSCDVLESVCPDPWPGGYARVVCWIDRDTGGIVHAEAFDPRGRLLKEFEPKAFRKRQGRWELEEMEILNRQTGSRTRLRFEPGGRQP